MRQQAPAFHCRGSESTGRKRDVAADGVGVRIYRAGRLRRAGIRVDADTAEITAEAGLEEGERVRIERLTRGAQHLIHDGRRNYRPARPRGGAMQAGPGAVLFFLLFVVAHVAVAIRSEE